MTDTNRRAELVERIHADHRELTRAVVSARVPPLLDTNLTMRQLQLLAMVAVDPGVTPQALADLLDVRLPTVSGLLDRLDAQGLLVRGRHETDRRRHPVSLSPEGEQLLGRLMDTNRAVADELFAAIDVDQLAGYADGLRELRIAAQAMPRARTRSGPVGARVRPSPTGVPVAILQFAAGLDPADNLAALRRLADAAVAHPGAPSGDETDRPRLLVAPEASMSDFGPPERPLAPVAQRLDGPFVSGLATIAQRARATVVAGMFERADGEDPDTGRVFNTLVVVDERGDLVASYRKIHLYDAFGYRESDRLLPGPVRPHTIEVGGIRFGLMTCYDLRFPEQAASLVAAGASALVVPAAWLVGPHKVEHWATLVRARAVETTSYVVAAGQCGPHYCGRSMIVDPMGVAVAELGAAEGTAVAALDPETVGRVRDLNPTLRNRR